MKRTFTTICLAVLLALTLGAQDKVTKTVLELGRTDNRTMEHAGYIAQNIGGRLVGTHMLHHAEDWVVEQFRSWGLEVTLQEAVEIGVGFDRGPWSGRMLSEDGMILHFGTPAYTAGTKGPQKGRVLLEPKTQRDFDRVKGALKGAWVLLETGPTSGLAIDSSPKADSTRAANLAAGKDATVPFYRQMVDAGVLGFIRPSKMPMQVLYNRATCFDITMDNLPKACDILLDEHQFEKIKQKVVDRQDFLLEFDIRNHFFPGPMKYHNILAVIKGSKYPDEYVMMGSHLDAYDIATGSTDDGQGVCVTMEAARLLAAAGAKPKRSIMFCIWTAEEYGLLGSKYFVQNKTIPWDKISNYFNRDGGPLAAVSITVPPAMYDDFVEVCKPLEDYNPDIPFEVIKREGEPQARPTSAGGSDHAYFAMNGIPAISFREQDIFGYDFIYRDIWHTEDDLYDKLIPEYMEHSAVVQAVTAYGLANLNHLLSREGLYKD
ncbi:MAG: M20/M25/M40 family metallo-hydrolase [Bacteroidales bacterium]|nr:M20/M25/M40 family metallo-hydrolase [Bacteroidales bacterium]MBR4227511.1 M20/M25/M40 family metallo-hydrolase [Bacteroidales bacterium]